MKARIIIAERTNIKKGVMYFPTAPTTLDGKTETKSTSPKNTTEVTIGLTLGRNG